MLKTAYQLGVQAAFDETDVDGLIKEATKLGLMQRAWKAMKGLPAAWQGLSTGKKTLLGTGLGLAGVGGGLALYPREEEQSALSRVGDTAKSLLGNRELMMGLTQSLAGAGGGGGLGLTPDDSFQSFPPAPEEMQQQQQYAQPGAYPEQYGEYM